MEKTDEEISEIAKDIIETNARRALVRGRAFPSFREEEKEFQKHFPYQYTKDQR